MELKKKNEGDKLTVSPIGRLDTLTSGELQTFLDAELGGVVKHLVFDFAGLDYISSAGLRVLLSTSKKMLSSGGDMTIANVNAMVMDVFEMTGFSDIFTIV